MFVQRNFLYIVMALAVGFAVFMRATVYQKDLTPPPAPSPASTPEFRAYWFGGKAELNTYRLDQAQYGAARTGEAVLVFVTEDFRTDKQVKSESEASRSLAIPVMKTNYIRRFVTGVYDYSLFTSVFTPIDNPKFPNTLKVTTSGQEWCGQSYVQVNYKNNGYAVSGRSYFEQEVAEEYTVDKALLEDELWNRIRLNPDKLPTGDIHLIPGTQAARLRHKRLASLPVTATLDSAQGVVWTRTYVPGAAIGPCKAYTLEYKEEGESTPDRKLTVVFETAFPHRIAGWEDTYKTKDKLLTSRAILQKSLKSDYWNHNTPADSTLRGELGL
ncbi:hypothetical protein [Fibrivirga algicola]|uniref:Septum formation inhibitor Maf n=1 Tax=Fibrivirga algicola TaxID=2950420 RepID=A0ABX0QLL4_9BACT|nr:hypothetical protein [Fibrivirga algicola]NID11777.1 hypothetical protein [Fibrivirga algicola]